MNSLLLRNTRNATSAISQCVSALSRELKGENASLASAAAAFNLLQMKGIASRSSLGSVVGNSSASTTRPASNQADIDGNASGAVADVTGVVNQLDEVRFFLFFFPSFFFNCSRMPTLFSSKSLCKFFSPQHPSLSRLAFLTTRLLHVEQHEYRSSGPTSALGCPPVHPEVAALETEAVAALLLLLRLRPNLLLLLTPFLLLVVFVALQELLHRRRLRPRILLRAL